jgi:hypothetical protein
MCNFIFVGEQRSKRAIAMGVTWYQGRLAARTLFDALHALGLEPHLQTYVNLWTDEGELNQAVLDFFQIYRQATGWKVVGMGRRACRELARHGIEHLAIIHPAARGKIRKTGAYREHLRQKLQLDC